MFVGLSLADSVPEADPKADAQLLAYGYPYAGYASYPYYAGYRMVDIVSLERGLLMLNLRPRLILNGMVDTMDPPMLVMVMVDIISSERGLLMLLQKPRLILNISTVVSMDTPMPVTDMVIT